MISPENAWLLFAILVVIAAVSLWLEQKFRWAAKVSACMLCLVFAMILSNTRVIPTDAGAYDFVWGYIVPLAIPFLLFKADLSRIFRESGRILGIFLLGSLGTLGGGIIAYKLLGGALGSEAAGSAAAMFTGTYVGGSVNLVAMADATSAGGELVSAAVVADNLLMVLYFFVLVAIPGSRWVLKRFRHPLIDAQKKEEEFGSNRAAEYWKSKPVSILDIAKGFAVSTAIVAVSKMLAPFFSNVIPSEGFVFSLLNGLLGNPYLLITTITAILATVFPEFMGNISGSQEIGTFMIHIFFAVIGAPASIALVLFHAPLLLLFAAIIVAMNMLASFGFGRLFGFSIEEITAASNANIGGPTTAAAFVIAKGWESLVVPVLLVGTLGYVIGNYYGIFIFSIF